MQLGSGSAGGMRVLMGSGADAGAGGTCAQHDKLRVVGPVVVVARQEAQRLV